MKICGPATPHPGIDLNMLDEIDIYYNKRHDFDKLMNFCNLFPKQRLNLCFLEDAKKLSVVDLKILNERLNDRLTIRVPFRNIEDIKEYDENDITYFIDYPIDSYIKLRWILDYTQSTDIYITDDLCYNMNNVKDLCNKHNVLIRMILNRIPSTFPFAGTLYDSPIFRPQDKDRLDNWIDIAEFDCWKGEKYLWNEFKVLYKRWFIDKEWNTQLNILNKDLYLDFPSNISMEYENMKYNCEHRCMSKNRFCNSCKTWPQFAIESNKYLYDKYIEDKE